MGDDVVYNETRLFRPPLATIDQSDRTLFAQCGVTDVDAVREIVIQPGTGLVITARQGNLRSLYQSARHLVETGYPRPLLLDANRYGGNCRVPAAAPFSRDWLSRQRDLGLLVLTDSGYVEDGDIVGLTRILSRAAKLGDVVALLPLHLSWFTVPQARRTLLRLVRTFAAPVAIVIEHPRDPIGVRGTVDGLFELIECEVPVMLLRCDVSALGALCCGAVAAAVGTRAALRHLYPRYRPSVRRRPSPPMPSVVVPRCLSYKRLSVVARTKRRHPGTDIWRCVCPTCDGSDLDWIFHRPEHVRERLAFQHSLGALIELRHELTGPDLRQDRLSWRSRCASAAYWRREVGWESLAALDRWQEAIGSPPSDDLPSRQHRPGRTIPPQRGSGDRRAEG
ncbi:hypothetical protein [Plantactinospora sp. KLBMP9567]|uniref:hypothetical protein n=1 Tax=Plantactinospora sp. KLBMP9567 TaxID=3085900 RepID=UPI00298225F0|nr:hypothetical protein [Plantactinospora sp. KLBMP9567]MDW5329050.1 hypothetical protein [Plantactinospora sp. KLBMP9567]